MLNEQLIHMVNQNICLRQVWLELVKVVKNKKNNDNQFLENSILNISASVQLCQPRIGGVE